MNLFNKTQRKLGLKYGLLAIAVMSGWFLLMSALGLSQTIELRAANLVFLGGAIFLGIREYKKQNDNTFQYFKGLGLGVKITTLVAVVFSALMLIYTSAVEPEILNSAQTRIGESMQITHFAAAGILFLEIMILGMISSFISLQWLKKPMSKFRETTKMDMAKEVKA